MSEQSSAIWRPIATPPAPLVDVLLYQYFAELDGEPDPYLVRIGFRSLQEKYICSYEEAPDGGDVELAGITHWAPIPAGPFLSVQED